MTHTTSSWAMPCIRATRSRSTATPVARASTTGSRRSPSSCSRCPGLSLFHPSLFFLTGLFGGGQITRAIHPWIGVVLFFSFLGLFMRFWRANLWVADDGTWMARLRDVLTGHEETPARSRQIQCRAEGRVLVHVVPDHRD